MYMRAWEIMQCLLHLRGHLYIRMCECQKNHEIKTSQSQVQRSSAFGGGSLPSSDSDICRVFCWMLFMWLCTESMNLFKSCKTCKGKENRFQFLEGSV